MSDVKPRPEEHTSNVVSLNATALRPLTALPSELNATDRALFKEIIGSLDSRAIAECDMPLFVSYVQITGLVRKLAAKAAKKPEPGTIAALDRMVRVQASLATRLRLSPQSRLDRKVVGRMVDKKAETVSFYDTMSDDDE
jgi:hypothetical protein